MTNIDRAQFLAYGESESVNKKTLNKPLPTLKVIPGLPVLKVKCGELQPLPKYQTEGAAGFDLVATTNMLFDRREQQLFMDMDIAIECPPGYYAEMFVRSSMGKKGLFLSNGTGIIDNDFNKNIHAALESRKPLSIGKGDRILQVVIKPLVQCEIRGVGVINDSGRGGFGSTGK